MVYAGNFCFSALSEDNQAILESCIIRTMWCHQFHIFFSKFKVAVGMFIITIFTPHAQRERGKVIGRGVHIYIYIYVCGRKKNLNRTLEIDSPFQTLTVGLLVEFID